MRFFNVDGSVHAIFGDDVDCLPIGAVEITEIEAVELVRPKEFELKLLRNSERKNKLESVDKVSVRGLREFILKKFEGDILLPAKLLQSEAEAKSIRIDFEV